MQIKTIMRHDFTSTRIYFAIDRQIDRQIDSEGTERLESLCFAGGNIKWYIFCGKQFGGSSTS